MVRIIATPSTASGARSNRSQLKKSKIEHAEMTKPNFATTKGRSNVNALAESHCLLERLRTKLWNYLVPSLLVRGTPETGGVETTKVSSPHA
jgi:hypothetical protein